MPRYFVQKTLSDNSLVGPIEMLLERLNREDRGVLREVRARLNSFIAEYLDGSIGLGDSGLTLAWGAGAPTADAASGSVYLRTDGGAGTSLYVREGASWSPK